MNKFKQILVGSLLFIIAANVQALPITGSLDMGGGAYAIDASGAQTNDASQAVAVDFQPNNFRVLAADGDFSGLTGQIGNIADLAFDPFVGPIAAFWTVDAFSFELTNVVRVTTNNPTSFLVLNGTGLVSAAGYDSTNAGWSFTSDTTGNGAFSWSAVSATSVPEPGVLALLLLGLVGFGLRKKLNK